MTVKFRGGRSIFVAALFFALLLGLGSGTQANAQILYGSIVGNVTDATDAVVPGAIVTITHKETNQTRSATTNTAGQYRFPTIQTGNYDVKVTAEGFRTSTRPDVAVTVNSVSRADMKLELGAVTESVTVAATGLTLQTDRAEVRHGVQARELENLPVPLGRNYQMLIPTLPGITPPRDAHSVPSNPSRAVRFGVNGTTESNNNTRIDGASQTNVWLPHMTAYTPSIEAIEVVNVVTNSFDAEQGLAGGAAINLQLKSGTNEVHGSAFWYANNHKFNAYPYFSDRTQNKPKFLYNQIGGTVGGPLKKDKIFYFLSYEGTRERSNVQTIVDVPDAKMRTGDLSDSPRLVYDPFTGDYDPILGFGKGKNRTPFPGSIIPRDRWANASRIIIDDGRWPLPNRPGEGSFGLNNNYLASGKYLFDRDTLDSKVNFNLSEKWTSFVRFSYLDYRMENPTVFGDFGGRRLHPTNSNPGTGFGNTYSGTLSSTYVASPSLVFDAYFGYTLQDTNVEQDNLDQNIGRDFLGIPGTNGTREFEGGWPRFQIDGFQQLGIDNNFMPYFRRDPQYQAVANGNWIRGSHEVRFGTDLYWQHLNHEQPEFSGSSGPASGGFRFRNATTTLNGGPGGNDYNAMASLLLGLSRESGRLIQYPQEYTTRTRLFSLYIRDRWQASRKLTVTYGTRWEYYPFPTRSDRGMERYDFDTNEMLVCGVAPIPKDCGISVSKRHFAPRLGIAYRPSNTWVVRAGYGITIDPYNWARQIRTNYPIMFVQNLPFDNSRAWSTTLDKGLPSADPPPDGGRIPMPLTAALDTFDDNGKRGYIQSWNFTLEKEIAGSWIASAGYVATRSVGVLSNLDANWADLGTGNSGKQLVKRFGRNALTEFNGTLGTNKYDSLQARLQRRFTGGVQMNFSYTWGHALAWGSGTDSGGGVNVDHPQYWHKNYGSAGQDRRHMFHWTGLYELPFGRGKRWAQDGAAAAILGGWQINNVTSMMTGRPVTATASGTTLNAPGSGQFADCIGPVRKIGERTAWWDPSGLADPNDVSPNVARFGTCGPNTLRGPGIINFDLGVFRKFQITERMNVQFRAEAFNISNTPHFSTPNSSISSASFGVISGMENIGREGIHQRVFRLGLRIGW